MSDIRLWIRFRSAQGREAFAGWLRGMAGISGTAAGEDVLEVRVDGAEALESVRERVNRAGGEIVAESYPAPAARERASA